MSAGSLFFQLPWFIFPKSNAYHEDHLVGIESGYRKKRKKTVILRRKQLRSKKEREGSISIFFFVFRLKKISRVCVDKLRKFLSINYV